MIKQKFHLLFCKRRRRNHETRDNSISLCVRALQYVRACKTVRHKPSVRTYDLNKGIALSRSGFPHPNYGNPDDATGVSAGGGTEGTRPSGAAANTNRKGYSRLVVSGSSVNVIANPVRVAPIPKVIAHVPTNIIITTSGVGL